MSAPNSTAGEGRLTRPVILSNIAKATSADAKRRIARRAFDEGIISAVDLMKALATAKSAEPDPGSAWSEQEDALLRQLASYGGSYEEISARFPNRSRMACLARAQRLGLTEFDARAWEREHSDRHVRSATA